METYVCPTTRSPDGRPAPRKVSSVFMEGNWTWRAYSMAHDGKTTIVFLPDGIEIHRPGRPVVQIIMELPYNPRDFYWHPDSRRVAFWVAHTPKATRPGQLTQARKAVAVMDVTKVSSWKVGDPPPYDVVYSTTPETAPFGLEWSPRGDALYLIQRGLDMETNQSYGVVTRIELNDIEHPKEIVRMPGALDFFMPPVSRFERGEGPSNASYQILFGSIEGLYTIDPDGKNAQRLSQIPALGLFNVEWNPKPSKKEVIVFFRRAVPSADGRTFVGAYLVRIDELQRRPVAATPATPEAADPNAAPAGRPAIEQLYDGLDVHTLWYSPKGTYITWATPWGVWFRRPDDKPEQTVQVQIPPQAEGEPLEVKGVTWHDSERKLAFTAGNKLFICELPSNEVYQVAEFGEATSTFAAEPRFVGEEVYLTAFENAVQSGRIKSGLHFGDKRNPVDPSLGRGRVPTPSGGREANPAPAPAPAGGSSSGGRGGRNN
jgi:hypothetical protein